MQWLVTRNQAAQRHDLIQFFMEVGSTLSADPDASSTPSKHYSRVIY